MSHPDILWLIRSLCEQVQVEGGEALREPLTAEDEGDSPEAREMLQKSVSAAKLLRDHIEESYEFSVTGQCEPREAACE